MPYKSKLERNKYHKLYKRVMRRLLRTKDADSGKPEVTPDKKVEKVVKSEPKPRAMTEEEKRERYLIELEENDDPGNYSKGRGSDDRVWREL